MLMAFEVFVDHVYLDQARKPTVGYGHLLTQDEIADRRWAHGITLDEAVELFERDLQVYERAVSDSVTVPLNANQYDALVSWCYNVGVGACRRSTLVRLLNAGDYAAVPEQLSHWNKVTIDGKLVVSKGLSIRRKKEAELWATPVDGEPPSLTAEERAELVLTAEAQRQGAVLLRDLVDPAALPKREPEPSA